jgi:hypothetical protein
MDTKNRESSVGVTRATGLTVGFDFQQRKDFSFFFTSPRQALGPNKSPIQSVPVEHVLPGIKGHGNKNEYLLPSSAEVKNDGSISSLLISLHDVVLN